MRLQVCGHSLCMQCVDSIVDDNNVRPICTVPIMNKEIVVDRQLRGVIEAFEKLRGRMREIEDVKGSKNEGMRRGKGVVVVVEDESSFDIGKERGKCGKCNGEHCVRSIPRFSSVENLSESLSSNCVHLALAIVIHGYPCSPHYALCPCAHVHMQHATPSHKPNSSRAFFDAGDDYSAAAASSSSSSSSLRFMQSNLFSGKFVCSANQTQTSTPSLLLLPTKADLEKGTYVSPSQSTSQRNARVSKHNQYVKDLRSDATSQSHASSRQTLSSTPGSRTNEPVDVDAKDPKEAFAKPDKTTRSGVSKEGSLHKMVQDLGTESFSDDSALEKNIQSVHSTFEKQGRKNDVVGTSQDSSADKEFVEKTQDSEKVVAINEETVNVAIKSNSREEASDEQSRAQRGAAEACKAFGDNKDQVMLGESPKKFGKDHNERIVSNCENGATQRAFDKLLSSQKENGRDMEASSGVECRINSESCEKSVSWCEDSANNRSESGLTGKSRDELFRTEKSVGASHKCKEDHGSAVKVQNGRSVLDFQKATESP